MNITARIDRRGSESTVPDNPGAVDATIFVDGVEVGEVTLLPDNWGALSSWGSLDNWASDQLQRWLKDAQDLPRTAREVVAAVQYFLDFEA